MPYNLPFQPYITPYVGNANKEFADLGTTLNQRFDTNLAKYDQLDSYANQLQVRDSDLHLKEGLVNDVRNTVKNIRENGNWENASIPVREVAKRIANDPVITIAQENFKREQAQKDADNKLRQTGATIDFNTNRYGQSTVDPETGRAKLLDFSGEEKVRDYYQKMNSMFEGVQADGFDNSNSSPTMNPQTGMIYQVGHGSSSRFISKEKIADIAKLNLHNYLNTDEGIQRLRTLTSSNSVNPQPLDTNTAKQVIVNELIDTGLKRVFKQTGNTNSTSVSSVGNFGQPPPGTPQLEQTPIEGNVANPILASIAAKTSADKTTVGKVINQQAYQSAGVGAPSIRTETVGGGDFTSLSKEEKEIFKKIGTTLGLNETNGKWSKEDIKKIQQFAEERTNTGLSPAYKAFTDTEIAKQKAYAANGNYKGRGFYSVADKKFLNFEELPKATKELFNSGKTDGIQFSGVYDTDNPFADMAKASGQYKDTKGWVSPEKINVGGKDYIVSSSLSDVNKQDIQFRELSNKISRGNRSGIGIYIGTGNDKELVAPVGNGLYILKDKNGKDIYPKPFTKEQIAIYAQQYGLTPED